MLPTNDLFDNLISLENIFNDKTYIGNEVIARLMLKQTTLELCGWIEQNMEALLLDIASHRVGKNTPMYEWVKTKVVYKNHGFNSQQFKELLSSIMENEHIDLLWKELVLLPFLSELGNLKITRDKLAHNYMHPQTDINSLKLYSSYEPIIINILGGFEEVEKFLKKNNFLPN